MDNRPEPASDLAGQLVTAFQTGLIPKLPDPPLDVFDSTKVDASDYAYQRLQMPDAPAMLISAGITTALAAAGGLRRAQDLPWVPVALAAKTLTDLATNLELGREEWKENKKLCFYCQVSTVAAAVTVAGAARSHEGHAPPVGRQQPKRPEPPG